MTEEQKQLLENWKEYISLERKREEDALIVMLERLLIAREAQVKDDLWKYLDKLQNKYADEENLDIADENYAVFALEEAKDFLNDF